MATLKKENSTIPAEQWAAFHRKDLPTGVNGLMRNAYLQYSVSANIGRAIPDVRDGLKPGARRILYAMLRGGHVSRNGLSKCAKVVGLVIGNYHPHGDIAVYDTMVRMAQDFSMRLPLIHGHGNFGSMDGDPAAAYRYTECYMDKAGEELLADLDKDTVDMRDTFDGKEREPVVLPAAFPNLLVNGSQGIGVGMATNIPPHNLGEVIDAAVAVINNPDISVEELMEIVPGPDYPTGGIIHGVRGVRQLYATGHGSVRLRGKVEVVAGQGSQRDKLIVTEIPYSVNKSKMVTQIMELANAGTIHGISSLQDLSSARAGVRIEISLKQDATPNVVLNELYRHSQLEVMDPGQLLAVDHNRPRTMTLRQILDAYIAHREQVIVRRTKFLLQKAEERQHIVSGLMIAQANIDLVVKIIRESSDRKEASLKLQQQLQLDEIQCAAILDLRLAQLTHLAVDELRNEFEKLQQDIAYYNELLASREKIMGVVRDEMLAVKAKYNTPRRTRIEPVEGEMDLDGLNRREIYMVTLSTLGYIKRCSADEYAAQNRGGSGVIGMKARKDGDTVRMVFSTRSHNTLLFFTNHGRVYRMNRAYQLPEGDRTSTGRFIANVLNLLNDPNDPRGAEEIRAVLSYDEKNTDLENNYVVMVTRNGIIKRCQLSLFKNLNRRGMIALSFKEGDDLIDAQLTDGEHELLLSSRNGRAVRFHESKVRAMGRQAAGVKGIRLINSPDGIPDSVVSMAVVEPDDELLVVTAKGIGKRTPIGSSAEDQKNLPPTPEGADGADGVEENLDESAEVEDAVVIPEIEDDAADAANEENGDNAAVADNSSYRYRLTNRGTQGVRSIKLREGDYVVAAMQLPADCTQDLLMLSSQGQAVRIHIDQVRRCSRNSQGVILMRMSKEGDYLANVSVVDVLSDADSAANAAKQESEAKRAADAAEFEANRQAEIDAMVAAEEAAEAAAHAAAEAEEDIPIEESVTPNPPPAE